jgi:hypothetical protein
MVWPLTWVVVAGTLPGVLAGALIRVTWLPDPRSFKLFAAAVLAYVGLRMMRDLLRGRRADAEPGSAAHGGPSAEDRFHRRAREQPADLPAVRTLRLDLRVLEYTFDGESHRVPVPGTFALSLVVGVVGGIYGIGGGAIIAPFFVSFFGLPVYTVAGPALMGTFVTSLAGVGFYQALAPFHPGMSVAPDWLLGALFGVGGMVGMYLGARAQKHVPARAIKWLLTGVLAFTAGKYLLEFLA